jgi:hypothetical protein
MPKTMIAFKMFLMIVIPLILSPFALAAEPEMGNCHMDSCPWGRRRAPPPAPLLSSPAITRFDVSSPHSNGYAAALFNTAKHCRWRIRFLVHSRVFLKSKNDAYLPIVLTTYRIACFEEKNTSPTFLRRETLTHSSDRSKPRQCFLRAGN